MNYAGCDVCDHTGWVCENHPSKPWGGISVREDACACGAGMLCTCVPESSIPWRLEKRV